MEWRVRVAMAPLWAVFLFGLIVSGAAFAIVFGGGGRAIIGGLVVGTGVGLASTVMVALARRYETTRTGISARADRLTVMRALVTGDAPADTSLDDALLAVVVRRRKASRRLPWSFGVFALVYLLGTIMRPRAYSIVFLVLWGALAVVGWVEHAHSAPRLARLEETLRSRAE